MAIACKYNHLTCNKQQMEFVLVASRGNVLQLWANSEHTDPSYLRERCQNSVNMKQLAV